MDTVPQLSLDIIDLVRSRGKLTLSEATLALDKNKRTIKAHIAKLVKEKYLQMNGVGKATFYTLYS